MHVLYRVFTLVIWSFKPWHFIWYGFNAILECELIGVCSTTSTSHEHRYKCLVLPNKKVLEVNPSDHGSMPA